MTKTFRNFFCNVINVETFFLHFIWSTVNSSVDNAVCVQTTGRSVQTPLVRCVVDSLCATIVVQQIEIGPLEFVH